MQLTNLERGEKCQKNYFYKRSITFFTVVKVMRKWSVMDRLFIKPVSFYDTVDPLIHSLSNNQRAHFWRSCLRLPLEKSLQEFFSTV